MTAVDALGYLAASLVLATFCAKSMVTLRLLAIASNVAFIAYALSARLHPIVVLHTVMLPLNLLRLRQVLRSSVRLSPDAGGTHLVAAPVVAVTGAQMQFCAVDERRSSARGSKIPMNYYQWRLMLSLAAQQRRLVDNGDATAGGRRSRCHASHASGGGDPAQCPDYRIESLTVLRAAIRKHGRALWRDTVSNARALWHCCHMGCLYRD